MHRSLENTSDQGDEIGSVGEMMVQKWHLPLWPTGRDPLVLPGIGTLVNTVHLAITLLMEDLCLSGITAIQDLGWFLIRMGASLLHGSHQSVSD